MQMKLPNSLSLYLYALLIIIASIVFVTLPSCAFALELHCLIWHVLLTVNTQTQSLLPFRPFLFSSFDCQRR